MNRPLRPYTVAIILSLVFISAGLIVSVDLHDSSTLWATILFLILGINGIALFLERHRK